MLCPFKLHRIVRTISAMALALGSTLAAAQTFPTRPLTLVVPFPAGGTNDFLARALAQKLTVSLKQSVIVENRTGAGGNTGADYVAKAKPDGYTLLVTSPGPLSINQYIFPKLNFDPARDFAPVSLIANVPIMLVSNPQRPFKSVAELISYAKAHPGKLSYGSQGYGTTSNLTMELFKHMAGVNIVHVPYRGSAPADTDLISGNIDVMFDNSPTTLPFVQNHQMLGLGVAAAKPVPGIPLPVIGATLKGFEASAWFGVVAPSHTPAPVITTLNHAINAALASPDLRARLAASGVEPGGDSAQAFGRFIASESAKWSAVAKVAHIKVE
jgi:tripartite-type tricarboxylate transporter receptor subunit TctC